MLNVNAIVFIPLHAVGLLTSKTQDGCGTPVVQHLVPKPDQVSVPRSVAWRSGLDVDGGPPRTVQLQAEHPTPRSGEELQLPPALHKHAGATQ